MLDKSATAWLKDTANELNNLLQQIYGHAFLSVEAASEIPEAQQRLGCIVEAVEQASQVTGSLLERIGNSEESSPSAPDLPDPDPPAPPAPEGLTPGFELGEDARTWGRIRLPEATPIRQQYSGYARDLTQSATPPDAEAPPPPVHHAPAPYHVEEEPAVPTVPIEIHNAEGTRELILVIDDDISVLTLLEAMLTSDGYRVLTARDGLRGIEVYRAAANMVDLVILDYAMPIMDGAEVFEELIQVNPEVRIVLASGHGHRAEMSRMLSRGLRGFIPKPFTHEKLLAQVDAALRYGRMSDR